MDPIRVADVVLAAALRARVEAVFIEPSASGDDAYAITLERAGAVISTVAIAAPLGAAMIARLAFLAELELPAAHASRGVVPVRSGDREAEVVITVRPGTSLRAELMVMPRPPVHEAALAAREPSAGDTIGDYRIQHLLGEGGMGTVYQAEHLGHGRRYALKVLRGTVVARDRTAAARFLREARTAARVRHPGIVEVFGFGYLPDGRPYFVMELLAGESLAARVARGPLPPPEVVAIARQLATALAAAHDRGVIHADVTPSNVLVLGAEELHVKLVDFGLAEHAGEAEHAEHAEFVRGTPAYISPEQLRGLAPTDRSDQYGLGAVLFELLTGRPPFEDPDVRALCMMHLEAAIPAIESPFGPLPPRLADVVTTCLQKSPQGRFAGMRALLAALEEIERVTDRRGWRRGLSSGS